MLNFITYLSYQFVILVFAKIYKFLKKSLLIHPCYYDFIFSGFFLHLLFKFLLFLFFNLILNGSFNIILLLLSIYICTIIDVYYYIHYVIDKIIKYCFAYFNYVPAEFFEPYEPESEYMRHYTLVSRKMYGKNYCSYNLNAERTRFYFFSLFFLIPITIRYFIIREPYFFAILHSFIIINYLQDFNLYYLFIYLFIIQITRFIFYMGPNEERFRFKRWQESCIHIISWMSDESYSGIYGCFIQNLKYDPKLLLKFTKNNMSLIMHIALRHQISRIRDDPSERYYMKLSKLDIETKSWNSSFSNYLKVHSFVDHWFYNLCNFIPEIYFDSQKFVKKNQLFWLSVYVFFIYFEYIIIQIILVIWSIKIQNPINDLHSNIHINIINLDFIEIITNKLIKYITELYIKINTFLNK